MMKKKTNQQTSKIYSQLSKTKMFYLSLLEKTKKKYQKKKKKKKEKTKTSLTPNEISDLSTILMEKLTT